MVEICPYKKWQARYLRNCYALKFATKIAEREGRYQRCWSWGEGWSMRWDLVDLVETEMKLGDYLAS